MLKSTMIKLTLIICLVFIGCTLYSQVNFKSENDSIILCGDQIVIRLNDYVGDIQWQKSLDGIKWQNIPGANNDSLVFIADTTSYYRAEVIAGHCDPFYSDIKKIIIVCIKYEDKAEMLSNVVESFFTYEEGKGFFEAITLTIEDLEKNTNIIEHGLTNDSTNIWWITKDNNMFVFQIDYYNEYVDSLNKDEGYLAMPLKSSNVSNTIYPHNNKALLLSPSYYDWAIPTLSEELKDINYFFKQKLEKQGYEVTYLVNQKNNDQNITLDDYMSWKDYGVISFSGHSAETITFGLVSGIKLTKEFYDNNIQSFSNFKFYWSGRRKDDAIGDVGSHKDHQVGITNNFFRDQYEDGLDNTLILMSSCHSKKIGYMCSTLLGENSIYWGWTEAINPHSGGWRNTRYMIEQLMVEGKTNVETKNLMIQNNRQSHNVKDNGSRITSLLDYCDDSNDNMRLIDSGIPTVETSPVSNISRTSATGGGNVISQGWAPIIAYGLVWSKGGNPTLETCEGSNTIGIGTGPFSGEIVALTPNSKYYVRAFATNKFGTGYGEEVGFNTATFPLPMVITVGVDNITATSVRCIGRIENYGGGHVNKRGIVLSKDPDPTLNNLVYYAGDEQQYFEINITGLTPTTGYYFKAFAQINNEIKYGAEYWFVTDTIDNQPCPGAPTLWDVDGNIYNTVQIGAQCWMKENLKTTRYRNGSSIVYPGNNDTAWENNTTGAYSWNNNDINNKDLYGALYNWYAITNQNGLCPTGWRLPNKEDYQEMEYYIARYAWDNIKILGNKLKSCRQVNSPLGGACNTNAHPRWGETPDWVEDEFELQHGTDNFGFAGLPGGHRGKGGVFELVGERGYIYFINKENPSEYWYLFLSLWRGTGDLWEGWQRSFNHGFSVRCIRDSD